MDPQRLSQLLATMEEQVKIMTDLDALSRKKSLLLVDGNLDELDILLRGEQALIWQMGKLEERRFTLQAELAAALRVHPSQLTLERLVASAPPEFGPRCQDVAERYGTTARALMEANQLNTELVQQAMAYADFSLQLLGARSPATAQVYSAQGYRDQRDGKLRRLDNRV
ncbi:MAG TPA: flagellar protein FlgN [Symbiobacteriaceae bacterium]|nr:flagellar protein FlgN [Symbiobacteriaceae bacterium]